MSPLKDFLITMALTIVMAFMMTLMVAGGFALFGPK